MFQPNNEAPYTHHPYVIGQSMPPSIHNPSLTYPPQFQSVYSNPSAYFAPGQYPSNTPGFVRGQYPSNHPGFGAGQYPSNTPGFGAQPVYSNPRQFQSLYSNPSVSLLPPGFGPGQYPSNTPGFGAQPFYSDPPHFQSLYSNPFVSLPPGFAPGQYPSNSPGYGAQPVYSDPGAASANWVVRQPAPVTYSVHNLPEITKIEGPWCDVCKITCTSTDCLNKHLVGRNTRRAYESSSRTPLILSQLLLHCPTQLLKRNLKCVPGKPVHNTTFQRKEQSENRGMIFVNQLHKRQWS